MSLRVLIVDSDPEETLFLQDALAEIKEGRSWTGWVEMDCLHAPTWADAESIRRPYSASNPEHRLAHLRGRAPRGERGKVSGPAELVGQMGDPSKS